jgi:hypothetical protein
MAAASHEAARKFVFQAAGIMNVLLRTIKKKESATACTERMNE